MTQVFKSIILKYVFIGIHLPDSDQTSESHHRVKYMLWTKTTKNKSTFQSIVVGKISHGVMWRNLRRFFTGCFCWISDVLEYLIKQTYTNPHFDAAVPIKS